MKFPLVFLAVLFSIHAVSQNYKERKNSLDIEHYDLSIQINDSTNLVHAVMKVHLKFRKIKESFYLDFTSLDSISDTGMQIDSLFQNSIHVPFTHKNDKLIIEPKHPFTGLSYTYTIYYHGTPKDGLIIGKNKHGDRTFFADNWPDRAHHWFPCVDHPSDKATIEYKVTTPNHYQTVANGLQIEETDLSNNQKLFHWKTNKALPTKVMVFGSAKFAVQHLDTTANIPLSTWVYPQQKEAGFHDFSLAKEVLTFFIDRFGEYPYQKLANVQSTTRYGGMENAGAIFYHERVVTGEQKNENLIAHEIAHQWFGNAVSEIDWPHIWLSEGFATYMTDLYVLEKHGEKAFQEGMNAKRKRILDFYKKKPGPVVDYKTTNIKTLLNTNSYQKGAWVLHMLRKEIGEADFWMGLQLYYEQYKHSNASTEDFKKVMEKVSGTDLDTFFEQWLYKQGQPILKTSWIYHDNKVRLTLNQLQDQLFEFPLDISLIYEDGSKEIKTIQVQFKSAPFVIECEGDVQEIELDPNVNLLFETETN